MSTSLRVRALALASAAFAAATLGAAMAAPPEPASVSAPVAPLIYKSPLADYRPLREEGPTPWRQANDTATAVGGWRAYAREAQAPAASAPVVPASTAAPAARPHLHGKP
jgi:hypothetical protein